MESKCRGLLLLKINPYSAVNENVITLHPRAINSLEGGAVFGRHATSAALMRFVEMETEAVLSFRESRIQVFQT